MRRGRSNIRAIRSRTPARWSGPYAEAKDLVNGYIQVDADDIEHAVELAKGCPILEVGGSVEVRPIERINM